MTPEEFKSQKAELEEKINSVSTDIDRRVTELRGLYDVQNQLRNDLAKMHSTQAETARRVNPAEIRINLD